ncbi:MAG: excinuclease subunit, partial [Actinomycetota bacterium]|nr:excinuclease subunit [Actinomycetota bacterium]
RIECVDVSNLSGTDVVASLVVFEDGLPRKSDYRKFNIRNVTDDTAGIQEVVSRRFARYLQERHEATDPGIALSAGGVGETRRFAYPPNLLVVDGGQPQVAAAQRALDELGVDDVAVCGLAKRLEEVWLPGEPDPLILDRQSQGLYLLQRIRDEAHRFAISHHRARRSTRMTSSVLDDIAGLGEVRKKALIRRFGSLRKLRQASLEEVASVPGIGQATATAVVEALAAEDAPSAVNVSTGEVLTDGATHGEEFR